MQPAHEDSCQLAKLNCLQPHSDGGPGQDDAIDASSAEVKEQLIVASDEPPATGPAVHDSEAALKETRQYLLSKLRQLLSLEE